MSVTVEIFLLQIVKSVQTLLSCGLIFLPNSSSAPVTWREHSLISATSLTFYIGFNKAEKIINIY